jgi:transcriptional regulator with XRE-family HTH domain
MPMQKIVAKSHKRAIRSSCVAARMIVASFMRELRTDAKKTQEQIGAAVGLGQGTISNMELGRFNGAESSLYKALRHLIDLNTNAKLKSDIQTRRLAQLYFVTGKLSGPLSPE